MRLNESIKNHMSNSSNYSTKSDRNIVQIYIYIYMEGGQFKVVS